MLLMNKNIPVMQFELVKGQPSQSVILNEQLLPELLKLNNDVALYQWLSSRSIDLTRSNARLLLKLMNIRTNELSAVIANRALSLTDTYWLKEDNSAVVFEEVSLYRKDAVQEIIETSLSGIPRVLDRLTSPNPELTNIGSYNKAWYKDKSLNEWWLRKKGSPKNIYAELFTSTLGSYLGMDMAVYSELEGDIISLNFTDEDRILEHYNSFRYKFDDWGCNDDELIANNFEECGLRNQYLDILLLDGIVCNPDRHEFNFGVIKNPDTGVVLGLAPNFDNNLSLGAESGLSLFMLEQYLNNFGIQPYQKKYLSKLSMELMRDIESEMIRAELDINFDTSYIMDYFRKVFDILEVN